MSNEPKPNEMARIARAAADLIEQGWCQNALAVSRKGRPTSHLDGNVAKVCLVGGIARVQQTWDIHNEVQQAFNCWLMGLPIEKWQAAHFKAVDWNNAPETTQAMVVFALREFARQMDRAAK